MLHTYDYILDTATNYGHTLPSKKESFDSDSDPDYWNESLSSPGNKPQGSCHFHEGRRKSSSFGDLMSQQDNNRYVLMLPQVDNTTLNTRWSLSSAEDEDNSSQGGTSSFTHPGVLPTVTFRSSLTHSCSETNLCPPEYDEYIACYYEINKQSLSPQYAQPEMNQLSNDTEKKTLAIRRTSSTPGALANFEGNRRLGRDLEVSKLYYNAGAILAHMDVLRCPSLSHDKLAERSAAGGLGGEGPIPKLKGLKSPERNDQRGPLSDSNLGTTASTKHSYVNLEIIPDEPMSQTGNAMHPRSMHEQVTRTDQKMPEPAESVDSLGLVGLNAQSVSTIERHTPGNVEDKAELAKLATSIPGGNGPSEDAIYCNPTTLNSDGEKDSPYYNWLELCESLPDALSNPSSAPSSVKKVPVRKNKKPMPPVRKRRIGVVLSESNLKKAPSSEEPGVFSNFIARQQESVSSIMSKPKSSPPVTPRRLKTTKKAEEKNMEFPDVDRDKIKNQLTKVLSVPSCALGNSQSIAQPQSTASLNMHSTKTPLVVTGRFKKSSTSDNPYLQTDKPKTSLAKSISQDGGNPRSANFDAVEKQAAKKPLPLPPKHKKLSMSSSFGGSTSPSRSPTNKEAEGDRYVCTTSPANKEDEFTFNSVLSARNEPYYEYIQ